MIPKFLEVPHDLLTTEFINKLLSYNECAKDDVYDDDDKEDEDEASRRIIILNEFNEKDLKWFLLFYRLIKRYTRYHDEYFTFLTIEHVFSHIMFICRRNVYTGPTMLEAKIKSKILELSGLSKLENVLPSFIDEEYFASFEKIEICYNSETSEVIERYVFVIKPSP